MRVLHVIPSVSPSRGGPSTVIFPMVAALRGRGLDVEIVTSDDDATPVGPSNLVPDEWRDLPIQIFPRWNAGPRLVREYTFCPPFARWLRRNIAGYDLLHVHALFSHLPTTAMRIARSRGVPYISRPLGQLGHWPLRQSAQRKRVYLRLVEHRNLQGAGALHFTSTAERDEAAAVVSADRGVVIPHGIDLPAKLPAARARLRSQLDLGPDQKLVLFLGRVHPKKGIDFLVRALAEIPEPHPVLLIAGAGDHRGAIERLAFQLGVERSLRWLGHVSGEQKQLCLQGADLLALTSHHENFGVAVMEALAVGTPVLVSDQVALGHEIARHHLGLVVPLNVPAIRTGMRQSLDAQDDQAASRRRAFVQEHHSWQRNAEALETFYRDVTTKSHSLK